jgi:hypothetical protein
VINAHNGLELIKVENKMDKILTLDTALNHNPSKLNFEELTGGKKHIILPVCGKRCYMNVLNRKKEFEKFRKVQQKQRVTTKITFQKQQEYHMYIGIKTEAFGLNHQKKYWWVCLHTKKILQVILDRKENYHLVIQSFIQKKMVSC